jgi:hypothetical protein
MILLDHLLLAEARKAVTGANIHRIRQMIFAYEQAVALHNARWPAYRTYQKQYELELRKLVANRNRTR